WPKSHKWSLFSTITSSGIDFQTDDIRRYWMILDDIIWMCASTADSGGRRNKENWIGRWGSVKGGRGLGSPPISGGLCCSAVCSSQVSQDAAASRGSWQPDCSRVGPVVRLRDAR